MRAVFEPALNPKRWKVPGNRAVSLYTDEDHAKAAEIEAKAQEMVTARNAKQTEYMDLALAAELEKIEASLREPLETAYRTSGDKRTDEQKELLATNPNIGNLSTGVLYQYNQGHADELKKLDADIEHGAAAALSLSGLQPPRQPITACGTRAHPRLRIVAHL